MMKVDLTPQSTPHLVRIVIGCLMIVAAVIKMLLIGDFDKNDAIIIAGFGGAGVAILFTNTVVEVAKALLPWKKT